MWWKASTLVIALALQGCTKNEAEEVAPDPAPVPSTTAVPPQTFGPREGLTLEAQLTEAGPFEVGDDAPAMKAQLVNGTKTSLPVVQLSDGSSQPRWREPYVFYSVERFTMDGTWERVSPGDTGRCGNHDEDWSNEVVKVAPGKRLELDMGWAPFRFDLQSAGPHRVRVHYRFQGEHPRQSPPVSTTGMAGEAAYEVVSAPVTIEVVRPIDVRLEAVKTLDAGVPIPVEQALRLEVHNQSGKTRDLPAPMSTNTFFEVVGEAETPSLRDPVDGGETSHELAPDAKVSVIGPKSVLPPSGARAWSLAKPGTYLVRARYLGVASNWTKVTAK